MSRRRHVYVTLVPSKAAVLDDAVATAIVVVPLVILAVIAAGGVALNIVCRVLTFFFGTT